MKLEVVNSFLHLSSPLLIKLSVWLVDDFDPTNEVALLGKVVWCLSNIIPLGVSDPPQLLVIAKGVPNEASNLLVVQDVTLNLLDLLTELLFQLGGHLLLDVGSR